MIHPPSDTAAQDIADLEHVFSPARVEHVSVPVVGAASVAHQLKFFSGRVLNPEATKAPIFVALGNSASPCIIELQERKAPELNGHKELDPADISHVQDPGVAHVALSYDKLERYEAAVTKLKSHAAKDIFPHLEIFDESAPDDSNARKYLIVVVGGRGGIAIQLIWRRNGSFVSQDQNSA